jgi:hypothetical protein
MNSEHTIRRRRLTLTVTDDVAAALDAAANRWPEVRANRELLLLLVDEGRVAIEGEREAATARRREAIRRTSGALTGAFEPGYVERLRDEWPA